ncbi:MAG: hypothetical protein LBE55_01040 [Clostridiales bacterium]|nr:hypothetical protein [Clostridiales bacterium]
MGMTENQFKLQLRLLIRDIEEIIAVSKNNPEALEKLERLLEDLQATLES